MTPNFIGNIDATSDKADADHDVKYSQLKFQLLMSPGYIENIDAASSLMQGNTFKVIDCCELCYMTKRKNYRIKRKRC